MNVTHLKSNLGVGDPEKVSESMETGGGIVGMLLASSPRGAVAEVRLQSAPIAKLATPYADSGAASVFFPEPLAPGEMVELELSGRFSDLFVYTKEA